MVLSVLLLAWRRGAPSEPFGGRGCPRLKVYPDSEDRARKYLQRMRSGRAQAIEANRREGFDVGELLEDASDEIACDACSVPLKLLVEGALVAATCEEDGCGLGEALEKKLAGAAGDAAIDALIKTVVNALAEGIQDVFHVSESSTLKCVESTLIQIFEKALEGASPVDIFQGKVLGGIINCICAKLVGVCECSMLCFGTTNGPKGPPAREIQRASMDWDCADKFLDAVTGKGGKASMYGCVPGDCAPDGEIGSCYYECLAKAGHPEAIPWSGQETVAQAAAALNMSVCEEDHPGLLGTKMMDALTFIQGRIDKGRATGPAEERIAIAAYAGAQRAIQTMQSKYNTDFYSDRDHPRLGGGTESCSSLVGWSDQAGGDDKVRNDCIRCPPGQVLQFDGVNPSRSGLACGVDTATGYRLVNKYGGVEKVYAGKGRRGLDVLLPGPKCVERSRDPHVPPAVCLGTAIDACEKLPGCVGVGVQTDGNPMGLTSYTLLASGRYAPDADAYVLMKPGHAAKAQSPWPDPYLRNFDGTVANGCGGPCCAAGFCRSFSGGCTRCA